MIDIHTHILPYVDDGSSDLETSIKLIEYEISQGVTDIFVTPHYYRFRNYLSPHKENLKIFEELLEETKKRELNIALHLGNEIYWDESSLSKLANGTAVSLGGSKHVLIEFSMFRDQGNIPDAINDLTATGYIPIIAHPERYPYITNTDDYRKMRKMGAKIQVNAGAIIGDYGKKVKKFVLNLIKQNLVDFVASDIHDFRIKGLAEAYQIVEQKFSRETADSLFTNKSIFD
ncbi:MAG: exopolysaccharide biosynthesis protein [Bacilli bacterium]|nr:exopolysaccharide biosynthesis protein [Bacilli bacterium]